MSEYEEASRRNHNPKNLPNNFDYLSNLPDSIISHILSFLPTKHAVASSSLSSRYKSLWKTVTKLHFSDSDYTRHQFDHSGDHVYYHRNNGFYQFVNTVLFLLESKNIEKFVLEIQGYDIRSDIRKWVKIAVSKNVKLLTIHYHRTGIIYLPACLYTSQSLENLYLDGVVNLKVPEFVYLPKLEELDLRGVRYGCVRRLISGCPALRSLIIARAVYDVVIPFTISSQSLRNLTYMFREEPKIVEPGMDDFRLELDAPSLRSLKLIDNVSKDFWFANLTSLDRAVIVLNNTCVRRGTQSERMGYINNVVKLLRATSNVKHLSLWGKVFEELGHEGFSQSYSRLTSLEASWYSWSSLLHFLDWSKVLEEVSFVMDPCLRDNNDWSKPGNVPVSLTTSLKTMKISVVEGGETELVALAYFLANAQVLRKAKVVISSFLDTVSKSGLIKKISELFLASKECEMIFENEDGDEGEEEDDDDEDEDEQAEEDDGEGEDTSEDGGEDYGKSESEDERECEDQREGEGNDAGEY